MTYYRHLKGPWVRSASTVYLGAFIDPTLFTLWDPDDTVGARPVIVRNDVTIRPNKPSYKTSYKKMGLSRIGKQVRFDEALRSAAKLLSSLHPPPPPPSLLDQQLSFLPIHLGFRWLYPCVHSISIVNWSYILSCLCRMRISQNKSNAQRCVS